VNTTMAFVIFGPLVGFLFVTVPLLVLDARQAHRRQADYRRRRRAAAARAAEPVTGEPRRTTLPKETTS
jgi:hypothetical protein